jgi:hypothetical protein
LQIRDIRDTRDASAIFSREFNLKVRRLPEEIADAYERAKDASYRHTADFATICSRPSGLAKSLRRKPRKFSKPVVFEGRTSR